MGTDHLSLWFGGVGITLGGELSGIVEVQTAAVPMVGGLGVRVERYFMVCTML